MQTNRLRALLKAGDVALGTLLWEIRGRGIFHVLARSGMDFVWICAEHSSYSLETIAEMVAHAHAAGITPLVRVPDLQYEHVTRLLDAGCQSLVLPHIESGAEVRRFVELARYYPEGRRGMAIFGGVNCAYEDHPINEVMAHANANTLLGVVIETRRALENLNDILIEGLDVAIVGMQDLSQELGVPGQYDHPAIVEAQSRVREICQARGIVSSAFLLEPGQFQGAVEAGARFLLYGWDLMLIRREAERAATALARLRRPTR